MQNVKRAYIVADELLLERAQVFSACLGRELDKFTARFPWMDGAWLASFEDDLVAAKAFPTDTSLMLDIGVIHGDLKATMKQAYSALSTLDGYAKLAWPTDLSRQKAFGQPRWRAVRDNPLQLAEAIELAHSTAQDPDFHSLLLAKGYTQEAIDQLDALATEIKDRNTQLKGIKADRKVMRNDRIVLLNAVWESMTTLTTCASIVWASDVGRRAQYQRYEAKAKKAKKVEDGEVDEPNPNT